MALADKGVMLCDVTLHVFGETWLMPWPLSVGSTAKVWLQSSQSLRPKAPSNWCHRDGSKMPKRVAVAYDAMTM
eukprot:6292404-Amphidinium_carterae.1